ncbi:MAG: hypothetical protein KatS3mg109_1744 [Pirellulaceae bacterium]|nr:MAG: hypothetical protein KatS3mg109_1744 [Pirellulaceae bacterium]
MLGGRLRQGEKAALVSVFLVAEHAREVREHVAKRFRSFGEENGRNFCFLEKRSGSLAAGAGASA